MVARPQTNLPASLTRCIGRTHGVEAVRQLLATTRLLTLARTGASREVEVVRLLAAGRSNRDIAEELVLSINTVERHASHIFAKTRVANHAEAATYAVRQGIVT